MRGKVHAEQPLVEVFANLVSASGKTRAPIGTQLHAQEARLRASPIDLKPQSPARAKDPQTRIGMLATEIGQIEGQLAMTHKAITGDSSFSR